MRKNPNGFSPRRKERQGFLRVIFAPFAALRETSGFSLCLCGGFFFAVHLFAAEPIRYTISLKDPGRQYLHVTMRVKRVSTLELQMPVWNATYQVRDFAQYVERVRSNGAVRRLDSHTWRIEEAPEETEISYEVFADRPGPFGLELNERHAFLNFAMCLMYAGRDAPVELRFTDVPQGWKIATALPEEGGVFRARNFDHLVDSPAELSAFEEIDFQEGTATYRVVVDAPAASASTRVDAAGGISLPRLEKMVRRIVAYETGLMRDTPFARYTFFYHFRPQGSGGMEHAESTAIDTDPPSGEQDERGWERLASVTAHEFFHAWNVKRIRPQSLEPVNYVAEQPTRALWFAEGVTSTYGAYTLLRTGLGSRDRFLRNLERVIADVERRPARRWQSAEESSLETWLDKYPFYRRPDRSISYYEKGEMAGFLLDLAIRQATQNRRSLDDLMRFMNERYAKRGLFFDEERDIQRAAEEVAGQPFQEFFDTVIRSAAQVNYATYLGYAGLELEEKEREVATLGFTASRNFSGPLVVTSVEAEGPAAKTRLRAGDAVLEINGRPPRRNLEESLEEIKPGQTVRLRLERNSRSFAVSFRAGRSREQAYVVSEAPHPTAQQLKIREGWLAGIE